MRVLISGASVAGPVAAYWLARYGFEVTVIERAATGHQAGGHAVDLFRPAMQVVRRMGVVDTIRAHATGMDSITAFRLGSDRPVEIDLRPIFAVLSDDHVEIMRDDLSEALRAATDDVDVEYLFGRTIAELHDGDVIFDDGTERRFDLVIGADGLHSNVRHLAFGDEAGLTTFLGTYLAVATVPKPSTAGSTFVADLGPNRLIGCYSTAAMTDARLIFLYRPTQELGYDRNDRAAQRKLLREAYAGFGSRVEGWLDELDRTDVFYLEGISQVVMDTWSRWPRLARRRRRILPRTCGRRRHEPGRRRRLRPRRGTCAVSRRPRSRDSPPTRRPFSPTSLAAAVSAGASCDSFPRRETQRYRRSFSALVPCHTFPARYCGPSAGSTGRTHGCTTQSTSASTRAPKGRRADHDA